MIRLREEKKTDKYHGLFSQNIPLLDTITSHNTNCELPRLYQSVTFVLILIRTNIRRYSYQQICTNECPNDYLYRKYSNIFEYIYHTLQCSVLNAFKLPGGSLDLNSNNKIT